MVDGNARPTRRRGDELLEALRLSIREELQECGYAGLTFEGVARRAQTSKPVIYRRYSSRAEMVLDAWVGWVPEGVSAGTTGSLRGDLLMLGEAFVRQFEAIGAETLRGLMADADADILTRLGGLTWSAAHARLDAALQAARERGEITAEKLPARVSTLPIALLRHELIFTGHIGREVLVDVVDTVCLPLMTGVVSPAQRPGPAVPPAVI